LQSNSNVQNITSLTPTSAQYDEIISQCKDIFLKKNKDYGTAWRILRQTSITDQLYIKAKRIKSIEEKGTQKIDEDITGDYIGLINYCIIALMQMELNPNEDTEISIDKLTLLFDDFAKKAKNLMEDKNHDYGEAWRDMRISTYTDLILMKLLRIKQIEDNMGKTLISEGVDANFFDILNYSIFALIRLKENNTQ
jgi:hypothetical protein